MNREFDTIFEEISVKLRILPNWIVLTAKKNDVERLANTKELWLDDDTLWKELPPEEYEEISILLVRDVSTLNELIPYINEKYHKDFILTKEIDKKTRMCVIQIKENGNVIVSASFKNESKFEKEIARKKESDFVCEFAKYLNNI